MPEDLATEDLPGVEILEADVRIHGKGSPPEGDLFTTSDLEKMAEASRDLADELRAPAKIGHSDKQTLLASGITDGEIPAAGWLENLRVDDSGKKLLADVKRVPRKVASLIRAGAYRTRSAELSRVKSQRTGKTYDWAVTGLAWLGGKMPAVRTLDDVVAYYYDDGGLEMRRVVNLETTAVVEGSRPLDVELSRTLTLDGASTDTRPTMPDELTLTADQQRELAAALKIEGDLDAAKLVDAAKAKTAEPPAPTNGDRALEDDEVKRRLEAAEGKADQAAKDAAEAKEELRLEQRRNFVESEVLRAGKEPPGRRTHVETMFDKDPEFARKFYEDVPANEDLAREYGSDEEPTDEETRKLEEEAEVESIAREFSIPKEEVV